MRRRRRKALLYSNETTDAEFFVQVGNSGRVYGVPANTSVLQVLLSNGIAVPYMCRNGICGTCLTGVLAGKVDHRDVFQRYEERGREMAVCVSRAPTDEHVVLDLVDGLDPDSMGVRGVGAG